MPKPVPAVDFLAEPQQHAPAAVCVLFGDEAFLHRQSLIAVRAAVFGNEEEDFSFTAFSGSDATLHDVLDELSTVAMFGGRRLVAVEEADAFVTSFRAELENYVARPAPTGVLVLSLKSFPGNTRLYKAVASTGLLIDCNAPPAARLARWLSAWAKKTHQVQLPQSAAEMLIEMIGPELGLLDQELAKLAVTVGDRKKIGTEMISQSVGGWRAKTTWEMLDAALDGDVPGAITQLDRLLGAGENPIGLLAQISATLRRFAAATRLILQAEAAGRPVALRPALQQAGIRPFVLEKSERRLRRLGRQRGANLYRSLLAADLDLKGASPLPPRTVLERLIIRLAAPREAVAS
jgi:DNA polymerase III subunit delta